MPTEPFQPAVPSLFFGENELYDSIMGQIEPELTSANIAGLRARYEGEPEPKRAERARKYEAAFAEYERRFAEYAAQWTSLFRKNRQASFASVESKNRDKEAADLSTLEQSILTQA